MPNVQELLAAFYSVPEEEREAKAEAAVKALQEQEEIWAAWFPQTKQYFIVQDFGQQTAVLFSSLQTFETFAEWEKEAGVRVDAITNPRKAREALFLDLWRSGFTRVMIDFQPYYLNVQIDALVQVPDFSVLPLLKRPVLVPRLTGKINYLMQQVHTSQADGRQELNVLTELYHAPVFLPVEITHLQTQRAVRVPEQLDKDGRRTCAVYTDLHEWRKGDIPQGLVPSIAWYSDLQELFAQGISTLVVNPGTAALTLDKELLQAAEKAIAAPQDFECHSLRTDDGITLAAAEPSDELLQALTAALQNCPEVQAAYLKQLRKPDAVRPVYLLLLQSGDEKKTKAAYKDIATAVLPYMHGLDVEISIPEQIETLTKGTKPCYKKKKVGFLRK